MQVVCCDCDATISPDEVGDGRTSHGLCARCLGRRLAEMLREDQAALVQRRAGICGARQRALGALGERLRREAVEAVRMGRR